MRSSNIKAEGQSQGHVTSTLFFSLKNITSNPDCLIWYIDVYIKVIVCIINYIYKQIHIENKFQKILYSFKEMYFLANGNPYGRSLSLRRHTYLFPWLHVLGDLNLINNGRKYAISAIFTSMFWGH